MGKRIERIKATLTRFAKWQIRKLAPPPPPYSYKDKEKVVQLQKCGKCGFLVNTWRVYADGTVKCIPCSSKMPVRH